MSKVYNVFVSHSWDHVEDLKDLKKLLKKSDIEIEFTEVEPDAPINSDDNKYVRFCLRNKIKGSDVLIALAGVYASYSEWMEWEMDTAKEEGLNVIGLIPWGKERISQAVSERSVINIGWNTSSIIKAIQKYSK